MDINAFGYHIYHTDYSKNNDFNISEIARVIRQDKDRYKIAHQEGILDGIPTGNLLFGNAILPVVGDWVKVTLIDDSQAVIHCILQRKNVLERKANDSATGKQTMVANIDKAILIQSANHDLNPNRLERYLAIVNEQQIEPVIIINKVDLLKYEELLGIQAKMEKRFPNLTVYYISCKTKTGIHGFTRTLKKGLTYCFMGSSGVGKSSLLNLLFEEKIQETKSISNSTSKGRHTTTRREIFMAPGGALIIDTPGMREIGLTTNKEIISAFPQIHNLAGNCRFNDCSHTNEPGCEVLKALSEGNIKKEQYKNFLKLIKEEQHYTRSVAEKRRRDKAFGKMQKEITSQKKRWKR